jgi:hypothetical protein
MPVANRSRRTLARRTDRNKPLGVGSNRIDPEGLPQDRDDLYAYLWRTSHASEDTLNARV